MAAAWQPPACKKCETDPSVLALKAIRKYKKFIFKDENERQRCELDSLILFAIGRG
jgi:hypothetical protein